ncbi:MAG: SDR family oxidoreductase [bacterium]|nr:SDR family oxidoreductase [bacterium]
MISFNKEQIFLVTGASSGLGEGTALLLNELGATVVGIARNEERLNAMKAKCKYPENMHLEIKDLTEDIENLPQYVKELKNKYGKFSGMAYCAGISNVSPLQSLDFKYTKKMFDINYFAPVFLTKGFIDRRNNVGKGTSIVAISSIAAIKCDKGHLSYSGAKAALSSSMKAIAREVASQGIRINCVLPSMIATPMTLNPDIKDLDQNKINTNEYPFGWGEVSDVANMIVYLLSDKAKFISGQNYVIDSGGVI